MLIEIPYVLGRKQLDNVRAMLTQCTFIDGKVSAEDSAASVKRNDEIRTDDPHRQALDDIVMGNLVRHPKYRSAALPRYAAKPVYARYRIDQAYGPHIDNPIMGAQQPYRSDIAVTLFLSDRDSYAGGELVVETEFGEQSIKLEAGDAVLYPASFIHQVNRVTAGERLVAVTWIQSFVRDIAHRRILFDISRTRDALRKDRASKANLDRLDAVYANLVRMWAEV